MLLGLQSVPLPSDDALALHQDLPLGPVHREKVDVQTSEYLVFDPEQGDADDEVLINKKDQVLVGAEQGNVERAVNLREIAVGESQDLGVKKAEGVDHSEHVGTREHQRGCVGLILWVHAVPALDLDAEKTEMDQIDQINIWNQSDKLHQNFT